MLASYNIRRREAVRRAWLTLGRAAGTRGHPGRGERAEEEGPTHRARDRHGVDDHGVDRLLVGCVMVPRLVTGQRDRENEAREEKRSAHRRVGHGPSWVDHVAQQGSTALPPGAAFCGDTTTLITMAARRWLQIATVSVLAGLADGTK